MQLLSKEVHGVSSLILLTAVLAVVTQVCSITDPEHKEQSTWQPLQYPVFSAAQVQVEACSDTTYIVGTLRKGLLYLGERRI